jgi:outer membrane protein OmpA-like peptidoglycan-associated protein
LWPFFGQAQSINALIIDGEQNIYLGTSAGLNKMSAESRQISRVLDHVDVSALAWSRRHGVVAACNDNEIWTADGRRIVTIDDPLVHIRCMMISGGQLWVGTDRGIYVISLTREEVADTYTSFNSALPSNRINTMYADDSGIKWIGTEQGVVRIEAQRKWRVYEQDTRFTAIAGNVEGVWLAGDKEMWLVDPYNRWTPTDVKDGLCDGEIKSVASDKQGRVYLLSDIFVQFNPYTDEIIPINDQTPETVAQNIALAVDNNDQLWVATQQEGLKMIDPEVEVVERPLLGILVLSHPTCAGARDGSIEVRAQGGRPPYAFHWEDEQISGHKASGLGGGEYEILITDEYGNSYSDFARLIDPVPLSAEISLDQTAEDQSLIVDVTGGRGELTYTWNTGYMGRRLPAQDPGMYIVTITDINGCTSSAVYTLEPSAVVIETDIQPVEDTTSPEAKEDDTFIVTTPEEDTVESVTVENIGRLNAQTLNVGQVLRIEQLQFQADSSAIQQGSHSVLDGISDFLRANDRIIIEIGGHTNGLPDHDYCDRLSTARAKSVADYLYDKGIPVDRISYHGYGKRQPIATNSTVEGRRKNQRVEVKILQM